MILNMKTIRGELQVYFDSLWAEHLLISIGLRTKPFQYRSEIGRSPYEEGFMKIKPKEFNYIDEDLLQDYDPSDSNTSLFYFYLKEIIRLADNRMIMGDYRYGHITRQDLDNYDTQEEFFKRLKIAKETKNLEYLVDAYNMLRIQYYKTKDKYEYQALKVHHLSIILNTSYNEKWPLISIDDGEHAEEK